MKLCIFDIDGTIIDSVKADDECFIETFKTLHDIDLGDVDWNDFEHVTDSGLSREIFQRNYGRLPLAEEIEQVKAHFFGLLSGLGNPYQEVNGALEFIKKLDAHPDFAVAFATGGWRETAVLKANAIGFDIEHYVLKTSNDHFSRAEITRMAIGGSLDRSGIENFDQITYLGDGLWDLHTSNGLGIEFIGVDVRGRGRLQNAGADRVVRDFSDPRIGKWLG